MVAVTAMRRSGPFTRADLDAMPDDGNRYELIDGIIVVSPSPSPTHQIVLANLYRAVAAACPAELIVLFAPLDVALAEDTVVEPDLLVARRGDFSERDLPRAPLLAVEVLSPSSRRFDLTVKRSRLEDAGCPSYWVVDPVTPGIVAWELHEGTYVQVAEVVGDQVFTASAPFPVELVPADLIG